jgi:hypothetical protein
MNRFAFGFHVVRSEFMATTALFVVSLSSRRHLFADQPAVTAPATSVPEGKL